MRYLTYCFQCLCLSLGALLLSGCGDRDATDTDAAVSEARPTVVCTTGMIADIAKSVALDRYEVVTLIGSGIDPHLYKPTRDDLVKLRQADVILYNGLHLEGKMGDMLAQLTESGKTVVAVAESLGDYPIIDGDPHVWMDVAAWERTVPVIASALGIEVMPDLGLQSLDAQARDAMASIPENQRVLITAHDAFSYFGRAYGIEVYGIQGISTESEAGVRDLERLIDFIVERQVPAVFLETSVGDKHVRALIEGCRARGHELRIGGELFSDAMGAPGTMEGTYVGMMQHNIDTIAQALGGQVPNAAMNP